MVLASFSACSFNLLDNSDVMRPPKATGNKAEIQDCIEKEAGGTYTLKYPRSGEYRTAIIMKDLTGDGEEESVALYRGSNKTSGINVSILDEVDGSWRTLATFSDTSAEIDRVFFCDINGDGKDEVLVGWGNYGVLPAKLTAYININGEYKETKVEQAYTDIAVGNFTGSKSENVILLTLGSADKTAKASLVTMNDQKDALKIASSVEMRGDVVEFSSVTAGYIDKDTYGVVADGIAANNFCITQVLYVDKSAGIRNAFGGADTLKRQSGLDSMDINLDGIIEVPTYEHLKNDDPSNNDGGTDYVYWNTVDVSKKSLNPSYYTVINESGGYMLALDKEWLSTMTAITDNAGRTTLYSKGTDEEPNQKELLAVEVFTDAQWHDFDDKQSYNEITTVNGVHFVAKITDSQRFTAESVNERFKLIR